MTDALVSIVAALFWFSVGAVIWHFWPRVTRWVEKPRPPIWERWRRK